MGTGARDWRAVTAERRPAVLRVALPAPLRRLFDYLPPAGTAPDSLRRGQRVRVPFGRRRLVGVLVAVADDSAVAPERLRRAQAVLDETPLLPEETLGLIEWAWRYYQHPPGEAVAAALPGPLRRGRPAESLLPERIALTGSARALAPGEPSRAPRQRAVLEALAAGPATPAELDERCPGWRNARRALLDKGLIELLAAQPAPAPPEPGPGPALNQAQRTAVEAIRGAAGFNAFLLDGVAGSGKTEVYLQAILPVIAAGRQALVVVPEIGLTPQLLERFERRLGVRVAVLHSGLAEGERARAWLDARDGRAVVVLGTRSAIFTPLSAPGLVVVDEEHDASLKQHEGFRYSARDLAVVRAQRLDVPVVLGSATPSLETLHNARAGRYDHLRLPARAGTATAPSVSLLDIRERALDEGLSDSLLGIMEEHLARREQVLVFLNRRGFAPVLLCHDCGWHALCERCDAHLTLHLGRNRLICHHCGGVRPVPPACPECSGEPVRYGAGTERIEQALKRRFPGERVLRIDRDTTRRRGAFEQLMDQARDGQARVLVGTQMLAKGHHLPNVTLVAVVNVDQALFGSDFRATERIAQLVIQVAGRAGRADKPGRVLIQTHHPDHPLLNTLITSGYPGFAEAALAERSALGLPPHGFLALLRAEAPRPGAAQAFLEAARSCANPGPGVHLMGPVPAPMERRQGRHRLQLLATATRRNALQRFLTPWVEHLETLPEGRKARWSIDIDPQDML